VWTEKTYGAHLENHLPRDLAPEAASPEFEQRWNQARALFEEMGTHRNLDLLELPPELLSQAGLRVPMEVIEDELVAARDGIETRAHRAASKAES
jgi:hypothetical protein